MNLSTEPHIIYPGTQIAEISPVVSKSEQMEQSETLPPHLIELYEHSIESLS